MGTRAFYHSFSSGSFNQVCQPMLSGAEEFYIPHPFSLENYANKLRDFVLHCICFTRERIIRTFRCKARKYWSPHSKAANSPKAMITKLPTLLQMKSSGNLLMHPERQELAELSVVASKPLNCLASKQIQPANNFCLI